jgi:hypothetical protein
MIEADSFGGISRLLGRRSNSWGTDMPWDGKRVGDKDVKNGAVYQE